MDPIDRLRQALDGTPAQRPARQLSDEVRRRAGRPRSLRLTFAYDSSGLTLVSHAKRLKPAPPSDPLDQPVSPGGVVAELHTSQGERVYRQRLPAAFPSSVEVPDPDLGMRRATARPERGTLSVVVPVRRHARQVVVVAGPDVEGIPFEPGEPPTADRPRVLGRFALDRLPPPGGS